MRFECMRLRCLGRSWLWKVEVDGLPNVDSFSLLWFRSLALVSSRTRGATADLTCRSLPNTWDLKQRVSQLS